MPKGRMRAALDAAAATKEVTRMVLNMLRQARFDVLCPIFSAPTVAPTAAGTPA